VGVDFVSPTIALFQHQFLSMAQTKFYDLIPHQNIVSNMEKVIATIAI
jgi:hypothetical protein